LGAQVHLVAQVNQVVLNLKQVVVVRVVQNLVVKRTIQKLAQLNVRKHVVQIMIVTKKHVVLIAKKIAVKNNFKELTNEKNIIDNNYFIFIYILFL